MTAIASDALGTFLDALAGACHGGGSIVVVAAHPDDETIGLGGHLDRLRPVLVVHVTDGAPRDLVDARVHGFAAAAAYSAARRRELAAALAEAGIAPAAMIGLGIPDQQAARRMPELARRLARLFVEHDARIVVTHPFEGGHPDHDATAFAVHAAVRIISNDGRRPPAVVEMACYHAGPHGPVYQDFAPDPVAPAVALQLCGEPLARKRRMIAHHVTQAQVLAPFSSTVERFRAAPSYDFAERPNGGRLHYETLPVHFTGADWRACARDAIRELAGAAP